MAIKVTREEALEYHHLGGKHGKISVVPTKPMDTQRDLSLAYTPGVAQPVLEIEKDPELAYEYTSKGNLVAVLSNGTAILGLGVLRAYGVESLKFGPEYIIPKPLDPRVLLWEAPAVAKAAMDTGVARKTFDIDEYRQRLAIRQGMGQQVRYFFMHKARSSSPKKRIVFQKVRRLKSSAQLLRWQKRR
jgi:malic enzyme